MIDRSFQQGSNVYLVFIFRSAHTLKSFSSPNSPVMWLICALLALSRPSPTLLPLVLGRTGKPNPLMLWTQSDQTSLSAPALVKSWESFLGSMRYAIIFRLGVGKWSECILWEFTTENFPSWWPGEEAAAVLWIIGLYKDKLVFRLSSFIKEFK